MYDYLAKVILLGPSGSGKYEHCGPSSRVAEQWANDTRRSCILHRFLKNECAASLYLSYVAVI
jgi:hypothetical protein